MDEKSIANVDNARLRTTAWDVHLVTWLPHVDSGYPLSYSPCHFPTVLGKNTQNAKNGKRKFEISVFSVVFVFSKFREANGNKTENGNPRIHVFSFLTLLQCCWVTKTTCLAPTRRAASISHLFCCKLSKFQNKYISKNMRSEKRMCQFLKFIPISNILFCILQKT